MEGEPRNLRCRCGETIITAYPPTKVYDNARFGPTFTAQVVVSKCADSLPLIEAKAYRRTGVQADDSTLGELFHRVAIATKPLAQRLLQLVAEKAAPCDGSRSGARRALDPPDAP